MSEAARAVAACGQHVLMLRSGVVSCGSAGQRWLQVSLRVTRQGHGTSSVSFSTRRAWGPGVRSLCAACAWEWGCSWGGLSKLPLGSGLWPALISRNGNRCGRLGCQLPVPGAFLAAEQESVTSIRGYCVSPAAFTSLAWTGGWQCRQWCCMPAEGQEVVQDRWILKKNACLFWKKAACKNLAVQPSTSFAFLSVFIFLCHCWR